MFKNIADKIASGFPESVNPLTEPFIAFCVFIVFVLLGCLILSWPMFKSNYNLIKKERDKEKKK